jgi:hypothetical protein
MFCKGMSLKLQEQINSTRHLRVQQSSSYLLFLGGWWFEYRNLIFIIILLLKQSRPKQTCEGAQPAGAEVV